MQRKKSSKRLADFPSSKPKGQLLDISKCNISTVYPTSHPMMARTGCRIIIFILSKFDQLVQALACSVLSALL